MAWRFVTRSAGLMSIAEVAKFYLDRGDFEMLRAIKSQRIAYRGASATAS